MKVKQKILLKFWDQNNFNIKLKNKLKISSPTKIIWSFNRFLIFLIKFKIEINKIDLMYIQQISLKCKLGIYRFLIKFI